MKIPSPTHKTLCVIFALFYFQWANAEEPVQTPDWTSIVGADYQYKQDCADNITSYLTLDSASLPIPPDGTNGKDNLKCIWDIFAWNSFAALNWPANTAVGKRALSSSSKTFLANSGSSEAGNEVVWEAFKEKRELFQDSPSAYWNDIVTHEDGTKEEVKNFQQPSNIWSQNEGFCTTADQQAAGTTSSGPFAANKFHNQLDETAEVQSQALEPISDLCKGYSGKNGEPVCQVTNESVVGPRVWMGTPSNGRPIYYEVKVNYDFFDYVMNPPQGILLPNSVPSGSLNNLVNDEIASTNALLNKIRLPWRSASASTSTSNQNAVFNYGQTSKSHTACDPTKGTAESGLSDAYVPCKAGAVHMKAAWIKLTDAELSADPVRYHTTSALYYKTPPSDSSKVCIAVDTFGLLGLHAIQRVKVSGTENPAGAFVFATFEHRSILDSSYAYPENFTYVNLLTNPLFGSTKAGDPYPSLDNALPVTRMIPTSGIAEAETTCGLSAQQTCQVNKAAHGLLGSSIWSNYRLVGTQFAPNDCTFTSGTPTSEDAQLTACRYNSLTSLGQPHFLANAVVETNQGLQHFLGLPPAQPRFQPAKWCEFDGSSCNLQAKRMIGPNSTNFDRGADNMVYGGTAKNMGGCQGCHGVAQQNGYSFSFVLLDGINGALPDTEDDADIPATALDQTISFNLQLAGDSGKYLAIGAESSTYSGYYNLSVTSNQSDAAKWTLQPFTGGSENTGLPNFAGNLLLTDAESTSKGSLLLGKAGFFSPTGSANTALVGPTIGSGTSRAVAENYIYLVQTSSGYALVSTAQTTPSNTQYLLTTDTSVSPNTVTAQPAATGAANQSFNIVPSI